MLPNIVDVAPMFHKRFSNVPQFYVGQHIGPTLWSNRCETPTRSATVSGHCGQFMLDPDFHRVPRDFDRHQRTLQAADACTTLAAMHRHTDPLGLHPHQPALMLVPMCNVYLQVRHDSLHVMDGGITMRTLLLLGNWIVHEHGEEKLHLLNQRLTCIPRMDDFTHFNRPLLAMEDSSGATRKVKMAAFWRCTEYAMMISQIMYDSVLFTWYEHEPTANVSCRYLVPEYAEVTRVMMAWAELYISMRSVAPTLDDLSRMCPEYYVSLWMLRRVGKPKR